MKEHPSPAAAAVPAPSPVMAQYLEIKEANPGCLLFFRMGDFFELFFEDAVAAAQALDIALTKRGRHDGADIPMCGVPVHTAETYLARLIRAGFKVAICDQIEDPAEARRRGAKGAVRRAVIRLVNAGTLTEEGWGSPGSTSRPAPLRSHRPPKQRSPAISRASPRARSWCPSGC